MQRNQKRLLILFMPALIVFAGSSPRAAPNRNLVILAPLLPYKSKARPALRAEFNALILRRLPKPYRGVVVGDLKTALVRGAASPGAVVVAGYYRVDSRGGLNLYGHLYNPDTGKLMDALNVLSFETEFGLDTKDDAEDTHGETLAKFTRRLVSRIVSNPRRLTRRANLEEAVIYNPIGRDISLPLPGGKGRDIAQVFDLFRDMDVRTASTIKEDRLDAPASVMVITNRDIKDRGYTNIAEILNDLPGFDVIGANGPEYVTFYQRGYRTPFSQRTLLLINGKTDNHLWAHTAIITRQYPITNIKKIEVLYGPASAVYGPNAFLGIINVITYDGGELKDGEKEHKVSLQGVEGSGYAARGAEVFSRGRSGDFHYSLAARLYRGDDANLSGRWEFNSDARHANRNVWGPILDQQTRTDSLGRYRDPVDNHGMEGSISYGDLKLGVLYWRKREGYGPYYPADRAQSSVLWNSSSKHIYAEYNTDLGNRLKSRTLLLYRESRLYGGWAEAIPETDFDPADDSVPGTNRLREDFSYISLTEWNSTNDSRLFKSSLEYRLFRNTRILGGVKFEEKDLTKAYDVPGYYNVFSSTIPADLPGPHGFGAGVGHSSDTVYTPPPPPRSEVPDENRILTSDAGGFFLWIQDWGAWRINAGGRIDRNSEYGQSLNPRVSAIYKFRNSGALKFIYGEAFQEPSPLQLFGGFSGRLANPDLRPEKVRNYEIVGQYRSRNSFHELSIFFARYNNVIKEEAENAGIRRARGLEYKLRLYLPRVFSPTRRPDVYFNYTYTFTKSSIYYDHDRSEWMEGETNLGDIAPHKANIGLNLPLPANLNLNLRGNYVSDRVLYSRNALREDGEKIPDYFLVHLTIRLELGPGSLSFKVLNLADAKIYHPGAEQADAGKDFTGRSAGLRNSLLPQPGRHFMLTLRLSF